MLLGEQFFLGIRLYWFKRMFDYSNPKSGFTWSLPKFILILSFFVKFDTSVRLFLMLIWLQTYANLGTVELALLRRLFAI